MNYEKQRPNNHDTHDDLQESISTGRLGRVGAAVTNAYQSVMDKIDAHMAFCNQEPTEDEKRAQQAGVITEDGIVVDKDRWYTGDY